MVFHSLTPRGDAPDFFSKNYKKMFIDIVLLNRQKNNKEYIYEHD